MKIQIRSAVKEIVVVGSEPAHRQQIKDEDIKMDWWEEVNLCDLKRNWNCLSEKFFYEALIWLKKQIY